MDESPFWSRWGVSMTCVAALAPCSPR